MSTNAFLCSKPPRSVIKCISVKTWQLGTWSTWVWPAQQFLTHFPGHGWQTDCWCHQEGREIGLNTPGLLGHQMANDSNDLRPLFPVPTLCTFSNACAAASSPAKEWELPLWSWEKRRGSAYHLHGGDSLLPGPLAAEFPSLTLPSTVLQRMLMVCVGIS